MKQEFSGFVVRHNIAEKKVPEGGPSLNEQVTAHIKPKSPHQKPGANNFENSPVKRQSAEMARVRAEKEELASIKSIFRSVKVDQITDFLEEKESDNFIFNKEIARIKKTYEQELKDATFLTKQDWKILTAIELCDKKTLEHSIGTYLVVRQKIEKRFTELGMEIAHEGVALDQLYRACLLHDIGKLAIPGFILNNEANDKDWINCFILLPPDEQDEILVNNNIFAADEIRHDPGKMYEFLSRNRKRAVKFVPVKAILDDKQKAFLIENDFDPEKSLGEIMQIHEEKSEQILKKLGFVIEALLAGHHHDCKYKDEALGAKPKSLTALNIAIEIASNLIHFGDVQDALNGDRSYSHKQPMLRIMAFLVDHAESGNTDPALTAHWINDELKKMSPEYLNEIRNMTSKHQHHDYLQQRNEELLLIYDFLSDNLPENHQDHEEQMDSRLAA